MYEKILLIINDIFIKLLGVSESKIDIHTNFLAMGIDSLILLQIKRTIQEQLGINIPLHLLLEDVSTINNLATHIVQELITEPSFSESIPTTNTEPSHVIKTADAQEFDHQDQKPVAGTVLEQVVAQQLQLMSKQLDLLQKAGLSQKVLPSSKVIQSAPLSQKEQPVVQSLTDNTILEASKSINLTSTSIKTEFKQQLINGTTEPQSFVAFQETEKETTLLSSCQQKHLDALITRFVKRTQESKRLTQAYRPYHANSRAVTGFVPSLKEMLYPIHGQRGEGARLWDVDGNEYVDISMGFGALLFGHSPSFVIEVIQQQIQQGILHGPQSLLAGQVAQLICELTGAERAAFCNDGTEAVMGAIRLARAATGRSKIALFAGSYHGTFDGVLVRGVTTSEGTWGSIPRALGIPSYIAEDVVVLGYGQPESLDIIKAHAHELAAILVEPIQSSQPDLQPKEFLFQLRQLTQETGTILIFDEVITGFRMHPGGIQGLWGIQADLTTYGKAVAAGMPIGVIAGKAALMDALDGGMWNYGDKSYPQAETTVFAGTFFKHPLVMAAAWAALNHIKDRGPKLQEELSQKTRKLANTLNSYFEQRQAPIKVVNFGSLFRFTASTPLKFANLFFYYLLEKGVYVWEGRTLYLSTAHTEENIEHVILAVKESVVEMQEKGFLPPSPISTMDSKPIKVPLTEAQKELWFLAQMDDEASLAYNESRTIRLRGAFNLSALRQAVQELVYRHEALQTTFSAEGDYQLIHSSMIIDIPFSDFSTVDKSQQEVHLSQLLAQEAQEVFNLEQGSLLRFHVVKLEEQDHLLVFTNHHIVADGWSINILLKELAVIYFAKGQGITYQLPQPMKWSEYALWQAQMQQSAEMVKAEAYWLDKFAGSVPVLELPSDRPRPAIFRHAGARENLSLSTSLYNALKSLSAQRECTLFTILLAAFLALLQRLTGQKDIVVGIASAGQSFIGGNKCLVGHCVNLLPIRSQVVADPTFTEYLSSVKQVLLEAYEHQIYPFIKLIENLKLPQDPSRTPLFTTAFNLDKAESRLESFAQKIELIKNTTYFTKYDLNLNLIETGSDLIVECDYSTDLFDSQTIQRWLGHFQTLLSGIVADSHQQISDLPMLTKTEEHQLLVEWNDTQFEYPKNQFIHQLFEAQVEQCLRQAADASTPDAIAVVFEDQQLTYQELNQRANQLAHHLQRLGTESEVLVGICMERSLSMLIGLLGILKAGGAYVPLDPNYPQERLAFILQEAQVSVLLTQAQLVEGMPQHQAKVVCLDTDWLLIAQQSRENPVSQITIHNLAYVIYTSGTQGKPKGVQISHSALSNFLQAMRQSPELTEQDTLLAVTTVSFDIAALELFLPITVGACVVIVSQEVARDGAQLSAKLTHSKATVMQATPATWQLLLAAGWGGNQQLKILCGGEALPGHLANQLLNRCNSLWNMYGPTETTIWSAASLVETDKSVVPISHPIANTQFYILNQHGHLVPIGVPGELHIGGNGLARGYSNHPELTAEKFIPNPFSEQPGTRLYKTGDLTRYLPSGEIEYIGRIDHQIKIRGFRIELGEIEALISQHSALRETVVVVQSDELDSQHLVAYVVLHSGQTLTITELRRFLELKLPNYMVPAAFVLLENLPLTPNGKVDRKLLPAPDHNRFEWEKPFAEPRTPIEEVLSTIWLSILKLEHVGIYDNFFELGGHSLLATQVISRVRSSFQLELPLRCLFESPTIAGLAKKIEVVMRSGQEESTLPIECVSRDKALPLSFAQQRLWFLAQLQPDSAAYNFPIAVRLVGSLNAIALQQSLDEIVCRHETLRTTFTTVEGQPIQVIAPSLNIDVPFIDLQELPAKQQEAAVQQLADREAQQPFDLTTGPLVRTALLQLDEANYVLLFTMHHIICDGWSIEVLVQELAALYKAFLCGKLSPLPKLRIQYADFAVWQRQWLVGKVLETQLTYWRQQLSGTLPVLQLPFKQTTTETSCHIVHTFRLSVELSQALKALSRQANATLFMTMLTAFKALLYRYTGQDDIVVGTDVANRKQAETEGLIGFFVNLLVLRTNLGGYPSFWELLQRVREVALQAYAHQDLPFEKLVEELQPERHLRYSPLFQVLFVMQNVPTQKLELPGLTLLPLEIKDRTAKFDLALFVSETEQGIVGNCHYNTDLFEATTIAKMMGHFEALLHSIVAQPDARINTLEIYTTDEKKKRMMAEAKQEDSKLKKFMQIKPKPVKLLQSELIKTDYLQPEQTLPLVIKPNINDIDPINWAKSHRKFLETELLKHGGILLRGFNLDSVLAFENLALAICPNLFSEYGDLPRVGVSNKVYGSTPYPQDKAILFHNESSHMHCWPLKIWFCCMQPAQLGGETPIVDCRKVYQLLDPKLRERFEQKQLMYVRNYTEGLDVSWQEFFRTTDKTVVEDYCCQAGIDFEWLSDNSLTTRKVRSAVSKHPKTGESVFFNQVQLHHISCLEPAVRESLLSMFDEKKLPRNVYYGDGSIIEESIIEEIGAVYQQATISFPWQKGDVLMLDNMLTAHGRNPYQGQRKIVVAMGEIMSSEDILNPGTSNAK